MGNTLLTCKRCNVTNLNLSEDKYLLQIMQPLTSKNNVVLCVDCYNCLFKKKRISSVVYRQEKKINGYD